MISKRAIVTFLESDEDYPDHTLPGGGYPSQGLPGRPAHPGNALPPPGSIATLPVFPFDPTAPDQGLPGPQPIPTPPIAIRPGMKFVVKWLACQGLILVPDQGLPSGPPPRPDQSLPAGPQPK